MTVEDKKALIALGRAIREVRDERSMEPDDLAATAGIERERLDAIEAGQSDPPYDVLLALARGLGIEPAVLVSRAGNMDTGAGGSPFGRRLRKLRAEHRVSQDRLACITGFHRTTISKLELGERDPRLGTILRLAQGIGVPPEAFVQGLDVTEDEPLARLPVS
jgi:transcriptional regulator with XRE-family HTH domain